MLTGRSGARAAAVAAELPGASGLELDVREESSVARVVDQAWSQLGGVDMLVNNAGIGMHAVNPRFMTHPQGYAEVPADGFRAVIETNLIGYFLVAREVTPRMLAAARPHRQHLGERFHHAPSRVRPLRAVPPAASLSRIMAADLRDAAWLVNLLLPGGATVTGMMPPGAVPGGQGFLEPAVMGAADRVAGLGRAAGVHDERIVAVEFDRWLRDRQSH